MELRSIVHRPLRVSARSRRRHASEDAEVLMTPEVDRFRRLPAPIRLADTIAEVDTRGAPDPEGGRDTDRDMVIRYGLGAL